jgi:hypothetical protein
MEMQIAPMISRVLDERAVEVVCIALARRGAPRQNAP